MVGLEAVCSLAEQNLRLWSGDPTAHTQPQAPTKSSSAFVLATVSMPIVTERDVMTEQLCQSEKAANPEVDTAALRDIQLSPVQLNSLGPPACLDQASHVWCLRYQLCTVWMFAAAAPCVCAAKCLYGL